MMRPIYVSLAAILALSACAETNAPEVDAGAVVDAVETAATEMTDAGQDVVAQAETRVTTEVRSLDAHVHDLDPQLGGLARGLIADLVHQRDPVGG